MYRFFGFLGFVFTLTLLQAQTLNSTFVSGDEGWIGSDAKAVYWNNLYSETLQRNFCGMCFSSPKNTSYSYVYHKIEGLKENTLYEIRSNLHTLSINIHPQKQKIGICLFALDRHPSNFNFSSTYPHFLWDSIPQESCYSKGLQNYQHPLSCYSNSDGELWVGILVSEMHPENHVLLNMARIVLKNTHQLKPDEFTHIQNGINIYKTSRNNIFSFEISNGLRLQSISIYNVSGHLLRVINYSDFYQQSIDTRDLSSGKYFLRFLFQDGSEKIKEITIE